MKEIKLVDEKKKILRVTWGVNDIQKALKDLKDRELIEESAELSNDDAWELLKHIYYMNLCTITQELIDNELKDYFEE